MTKEITYKEPRSIILWMDAALKKEWQKWAAIPVKPDMVPEYEEAQAWGYVVAGYSLIEQGLKAVLHMRGANPPKMHALFCLFKELSEEDKDVLRAYFDDFRQSFPGIGYFPLKTLDAFLENLDGTKNDRGHYAGSFDWRYYPIEEGSGAAMPLVNINVMHEIVYGCIRLVESLDKQDDSASKATYSCRLQWKRLPRYKDWLFARMNSPGWDIEKDCIEILWGPDYSDRHDYLVFQNGQTKLFFAPLPDTEDVNLVIKDMRPQLEPFSRGKSFQSTGVTLTSPHVGQEATSCHLMY